MQGEEKMKTIQPQTDRSKGMPVAVFVLFNNNFIKNPTKGRKFPVAQVAGKVEGCYNIIDFYDIRVEERKNDPRYF